jgi:DNA-binding response OmpR family regulator
MSTGASDLYEFGTFRMDVQRRVVTRGGNAIPLAPKTFELLAFLVRSGGRGVETGVDDRAVAGYVRRRS